MNINQRPTLSFLTAVIAWFVVSGPVLAEKTLVLNTAFTSPLSNDAQSGFADVIVGKALHRIGYQLKTVRLPAERALINANAGIDDGDLLRIDGLQKSYPNLIQVPEKVMDIEFVVFTTETSFPIKGWKSLKPYSVAIITGWKILERNIPAGTDLIKVKNVDQLFTLLLKNRVDAIVYSRWVGLGYIKQHKIREIRILGKPLARRKMYVYLHKKHKNLVPRLAKSLRHIKANGDYRRAFRKILAPYSRR